METTSTLYNFALLLLGVGFGCLHRWHVSTLFENDRHFSHLSEIEREMSFRTEMGMYYSYFKTIVESENIFQGIEKICKDNISEYGHVINAATKYSLFPEIIAGHLYYVAKKLGLLSKEECWEIDRGYNLAPVTSCEGLGVPMYFYLEIAWLAAQATVVLLFLYSTYLSNSVFGGFVTILAFFYNHNECTRVQWTPSLRETFGYPFLLYQMFTVTMAIRIYSRTEMNKMQPIIDPLIGLLGIIHCTTFMSLITWQFSCFVLTTQVIALLLLKWLRLIPDMLFNRLIIIHAAAIALGVLLGDTSRIISSLYTCLILGCIITGKLVNKLPLSSGMFKIIVEIMIILLFTKFLKSYILTSEEYAHVFDILKSKLMNYRDFHTMLYTCSPEFDFLQYRTYEVIVSTMLLPIAVLAGILALYYWYRNYRTFGYPKCIEAEVVYNGLQAGAFIIMAVFVMRLKLLMTPHLCIMAGSVCSKRYLEKIGLKSEKVRCSMIILLIALMSYPGIDRVREERSVIGEYGNIEQEELFEWIKRHTPENAVFAGKMSLMANVMLSTRRAIVNNPYYESKEMRDRTMKVYEIFSRKDAVSVYSTLKSMKVDYVILEKPLCFGLANSPTGCQMIDLWDLVDNGTAKMAGKPALCPLLFFGNAYPFRKVFQNDYYVLLQLDYSHYIELKPKTAVELDY